MIQDISLWILWYPVRYLAWVLPLQISLTIGKYLGSLFGLLLRNRREDTTHELSLLHLAGTGKEELKRMVSRSHQLWGMSQIEVLLFPKMKLQLIDKLVPQLETAELDKALQKGRGAVLLVAHFGSNRIVLPVLGNRSYKVIQLGAPSNIWKEITPDEISSIKGKVLDLESQFEQQLPVEFIFGNMAIRRAIEALKANNVLVVAADGRGGERWAEVDFFQRKALFSLVPFILARKTGAALLPIFAIRQRNNYHKLIINQPLQHDKGIDLEEVIKEYVKILESYIRCYPCHYAEFLRFTGKRSRMGDISLFVDQGSRV